MKGKRLVRAICIFVLLLPAAGLVIVPSARGKATCDSLYYLLQDLAVNHVRANEVWVEHFIDCPGTPDTMGGFILSALNEDGMKDRAIIAYWNERVGWQYRFGERMPNIRFYWPAPRLDINGDGEADYVFTATDRNHPHARCFRILMVKDGKKFKIAGIHQPKGLVIDSILPAPAGSPRPLKAADRRGWDIGGLINEKAPISYRYLTWDTAADPPGYVNQTAAHRNLFPVMQKRATYIKALPKTGELRYENEAAYGEFLHYLIGYSLDQSNLGREEEGYGEVTAILDRVKYEGPTKELWAPRTLRNNIHTIFPQARKLPRQKK